MSEAVALGATCPYDLAVARSDQAQQKLRGFVVPAPQTAGSFLRRFTLGHIGQLNKALRAVHLTAFRLLGVQSGDRVTLDFDSTYVRSYSSRREGADPTWTKRYALHPLLCFVAESSTCLHAKLRRGKAHTSKGIAGFVGECLNESLEGSRSRARFDSGFYSKDPFAMLEEKGVAFLCGAVITPRLTSIFSQISDSCWAPCADKDEGEVSEFDYRSRDDYRFRCYIVKRIPVKVGEQMELETRGYHYWLLGLP